MPSDRSRYPADWPAISARIRARSDGHCECHGECGLHRVTGGPRRCVEINGEPARWARGKVVLTVAHLNATGGPCQCEPLCGRGDHLKAMCQRCHLRYDVALHVRSARSKRRAKKNTREMFE